MAPDASARTWLIVSADDFGSSRSVNRGIERGCREGVVTSASLTACGAAFADAVERLDELPQMGVGVHLTLADGRAAGEPAAAPTLVAADGTLPRDALAFARSYFSGKIAAADVRAELRAQLARVRDAGVRPTHVDSHRHLHNFPGVAPVVVELAREFGVRAVRLSRCRLWPARRGWLGRQLALRVCAEAFGRLARRAGLKMPEGLECQEWAGALTTARLVAAAAKLRPGKWELVCHPAAENSAGDEAAAYDRAGELAALTSPAVRDALEERGVKLINYAAL
jgi:hopanoid biosynthesis associated protein HpnK